MKEKITVYRSILADGARSELSSKTSTVVVTLLAGTLCVKLGGLTVQGVRRLDVFRNPPYSWIAEPGTGLLLWSPDWADVVVSRVSKNRVVERSLYLPPEAVRVRTIGEGNFERTVRTIWNEAGFSFGETIQAPGQWSSWPRHRYTYMGLENEYEEYMLFITKPQHGKALAYFYDEPSGEEKVRVIRSGDLHKMPYGEHPYAAFPDTWLYYYWITLGAPKDYTHSALEIGGYRE